MASKIGVGARSIMPSPEGPERPSTSETFPSRCARSERNYGQVPPRFCWAFPQVSWRIGTPLWWNCGVEQPTRFTSACWRPGTPSVGWMSSSHSSPHVFPSARRASCGCARALALCGHDQRAQGRGRERVQPPSVHRSLPSSSRIDPETLLSRSQVPGRPGTCRSEAGRSLDRSGPRSRIQRPIPQRRYTKMMKAAS